MGLFGSKTSKGTKGGEDGNAQKGRGGGAASSGVQKFFKCPYCFEKIFPQGVAFRSMTAYTQQDLDDFSGEEREKKKLYVLSSDELYEKFWNRYPGSKPEDSERNKTYERNPVITQLPDKRFLNNEKFTDSACLVFEKDEDGFLNAVVDTEGNRSRIRICPHCHNKLPFEFGKYPIKYIPVVGITSSGKTVYLSQILGKIKEILIRADMTVAGLCPEVDEFVKNHTIRRGQHLPGGNATNVLTTPVPVNVKNNKDGRRYTLVFYDIAGENCVDADQMEKYGQFICNADGIIMIMDPRQFTDLIYLGNDDEDNMDDDTYSPDKVVAAMYTAFVAADFAGGQSDIPIAATLSKSDLLKGTGVIGDYSNMFQNIRYNDYEVRGFPYEDCINVNTEVKMMLTRKSIKGEILDNQLKQFFPNHSYFAFSALNGMPVVSEEGSSKRYQMEVNPEAVRVEEPLFWLLYKMNIIDKAVKNNNRR